MRFTAETSEVLELQNFSSKRPLFHLSSQDGHLIFVSGCLISAAVNLSSYGWLIELTG